MQTHTQILIGQSSHCIQPNLQSTNLDEAQTEGKTTTIQATSTGRGFHSDSSQQAAQEADEQGNFLNKQTSYPRQPQAVY